MTCMPEAKLAREAELCYALVALPTDYDCWRPADPNRPHAELLREILGNLERATHNALALIREAIRIAPQGAQPCHCGRALEMAIWSNKQQVRPEVRDRIELLAGRYLRK